MSGSTDSYTSLKAKLELVPAGVLVIGSHTQLDSRKEKVKLYITNSWLILIFLPSAF